MTGIEKKFHKIMNIIYCKYLYLSQYGEKKTPVFNKKTISKMFTNYCNITINKNSIGRKI